MRSLGHGPKGFHAWDDIFPLAGLHIWRDIVRDAIGGLLGAFSRLHAVARGRTRRAIARGAGVPKCLAVRSQLIQKLWGDNSDPMTGIHVSADDTYGRTSGNDPRHSGRSDWDHPLDKRCALR